jgi:hypothetical protein
VKVLVIPADRHGCGAHRLIWPSEELRRAGHDVTVVDPSARRLELQMDGNEVLRVNLDPSFDVVVMQRVSHAYLCQAVGVLRGQGHAVVVDVDDDLAAIHPSNPAFTWLHPTKGPEKTNGGQPNLHSWANVARACRDASLVTATTPVLLQRYAAHGRGVVLPNYLAEHYYGIPHENSDLVGWPAALHSHPDDPQAVGPAIARLVGEGYRFRGFGLADDLGKAFGVPREHWSRIDGYREHIELEDWPVRVAELGIGLAPLADTRFNQAKSWLKPLELAAAGVPWVGSPRAEYQRLHRMGCGVLVDRPKDWYSRVRRLVGDSALRADLSARGRAVAEELRLRDHAWRWTEAWEQALVLDDRLVRS